MINNYYLVRDGKIADERVLQQFNIQIIKLADSLNIPVVAIGGITLENASQLKDTGIAGLSVVSAIMSAENPKKASQDLLNIFNS